MKQSDPPREPVQLPMTIGAVSRATGIPTNTLRTWERRYGFPEPERASGGQRLYPATVVPHLELIARALDRGHRAGQILPLTYQQLRDLMGVTPPSAQIRPASVVEWWLTATQELDAQALDAWLEGEYARLTGVSFLVDRVQPFLDALGEAWERGDITVYQEHFASERVRAFLNALWVRLSAAAPGKTVVCATLPGEQHALGLHMAATVLAMSGSRVLFLGASTPVDDIVAAAAQVGAAAVGISVSAFSDLDAAETSLAQLRKALPRERALIVGGAGAPAVAGAIRIVDLAELAMWRPR